MNEIKRLEKYIIEGFKTHMVIRKIPDDKKKSQLPEFYWDKEVYALPLWHEDNRKIMFYFIDKETKEYAQSLVKEGKEVIGYHLVVYISVLSSEAVEGRQIFLEPVIASLKEVKGWDARPSQYPNVFEVHFNIDSGEKQKVEQSIWEVEKMLLLLTLKNKKGVHITSYSPGEKYRHQPFSINVGLVETKLDGVSITEIEKYSDLLKNDTFLKVVNSLRLLYSQINNTAKITACWNTIEDFFSCSKPIHILTQVEIKEITKAINNTSLEEEKKTVIVKKIKDSSLFPQKTRNERIAENISTLLGQDVDIVKEQLSALSKIRGKSVHSINTDDSNMQPYLQFTEKILLEYLNKVSITID